MGLVIFFVLGERLGFYILWGAALVSLLSYFSPVELLGSLGGRGGTAGSVILPHYAMRFTRT